MVVSRSPGKGSNQESIRRLNLGAVLRHVHRVGELTRSELGRRTWLNRSTIADLTSALEAAGITERTDPVGQPGMGRPSAGVRASRTGPFVIAVELTVERTEVARVGLGGQVESRTSAEIGGHANAEEVARTTAALIREVVADASPLAPLVGIGVAVPGLVRRSDGLVRLAPNLGWHDVPFGRVLSAALGVDVPVVVANEADVGALAERERGAGVDVDDMIYISGQIGVGAGVIMGGHPIAGVGGYAGEVGHLQLDPAGPPCHCGSNGCWETSVGGHAIASAIGCPASEVGRLADHLSVLQDVPSDLRRIGSNIGRGLASIVNAYNPQVVLLGGYFRALYPLVRVEIDTALEAAALPAAVELVTLALPELGTDAIVMGAAEAAFEPFFLDPLGAAERGLQDVMASLAPGSA
jgi:predicted NBD/HSP70 family sugar kinase